MHEKEIGQRLTKIRLLTESNGKQFAKLLKIGLSYYYQIERGERTLPQKALYLLSSELGVNLNWLLTGEGEMFIKGASQPINSNTISQGDNGIAIQGSVVNGDVGHKYGTRAVDEKTAKRIDEEFKRIEKLSLMAGLNPPANRENLASSFCRKFRVDKPEELPEYLWPEAEKYLEDTADSIIEKGLKSRAKEKFAILVNKEIEDSAKVIWGDHWTWHKVYPEYPVTYDPEGNEVPNGPIDYPGKLDEWLARYSGGGFTSTMDLNADQLFDAYIRLKKKKKKKEEDE
ncbi:MAG: helix-turn-helix domain-containing protein [Acidobacteria bacterium]|nr:helix-turn-helix domain-containing protein [Acidobacteriota bacterium]